MKKQKRNVVQRSNDVDDLERKTHERTSKTTNGIGKVRLQSS